MAGLLAAHMLRRPVSIVEAAAKLPNNHKALLRFRTSAVGDLCGVPFQKVKVLKCVASDNNDAASAMEYARKVTGEYSLRSLSSSFTTEIVERFIAPDDCIERMGQPLVAGFSVAFATDVTEISSGHLQITDLESAPPSGRTVQRNGPIISTMPMPKLMDLLQYQGERPKFRYRSGFTVRFNVKNANAHATVYIPSRHVQAYRASITGNHVMIEYACDLFGADLDVIDNAIEIADEYLGISPHDIDGAVLIHPYHYAKIAPIDEDLRRSFIVWASMHYNVYSLGRFATWRPGLLMDDVVNDVRVIDRLISGNNVYEHLLRS